MEKEKGSRTARTRLQTAKVLEHSVAGRAALAVVCELQRGRAGGRVVLVGARRRFLQDGSRGDSSRPVMATLGTTLALGYSSQPAHAGVHPSITAGNVNAAF